MTNDDKAYALQRAIAALDNDCDWTARARASAGLRELLADVSSVEGADCVVDPAGGAGDRNVMHELRDLIEEQCDNMACGTQMREFLRGDDGSEPHLREMLRLNLEQFANALAYANSVRKADARSSEETTPAADDHVCDGNKINNLG